MIVLVLKIVISLICFNPILSYEFDGLNLSDYIAKNDTVKGREASKVDSSYFAGVDSYSGYFTVKKDYNSTLFFWYFPVEGKPVEENPLIIWLSGGPGVSSLLGLFEVGPLKYKNGKLSRRNVTWNSDYSLLFIDNPTGAGFSFTEHEDGYTTTEEEIADQLHTFLQQFLQIYPETKQVPLYLAGQSYAGKYIPNFAWKIHTKLNETKVNLKGISLGNALIDPETMLPHYNELLQELGLLEDHEVSALKSIEEDVLKLIREKKWIDASNKYNETIEYIKRKTEVSIYNFMKEPKPISAEFEEFIKRNETRHHLHAGTTTEFNLNNQKVYNKMLPDIMVSSKSYVENLLAHNYSVMCYNGQLDLFVPFSLSKRTYDSLNWPGQDEYKQAPRIRIKYDESDHTSHVVAYKKAGGNFVEILVRRAGHAVPGDQPEVAKAIIDLFIKPRH